MFSADDDYARIGHVPPARTVGIEIVADQCVLRNTDILVQDGAAHLGVAPDVAVVHDDAAFYQGAGVDADIASQNGLAHDTAGKNASARYDAVEGFAAAIGLVERELGGRIPARFFDAYLQSRLNSDLDPYVLLLGSASFYLCDLPGSSVVLARRIGSRCPDLEGGGLEKLLHWILQADLSSPMEISEGYFRQFQERISLLLRQFFTDGQASADLFSECDQLRRTAYNQGTPRQLLLSDVVCSVVRKKHRNSAWYSLPAYTAVPEAQWITALRKSTFIRELWPAQHLLGSSGVLRSASAVVQMPTSAGKTRATELIIRSAFLSSRTSLAVIVAPFRALCHEIKNSLAIAFRNEPVSVDELSDVSQGDFELTELLPGNQVLVVTPEKFVYVLRHSPELAPQIGVLILDEGHQFDSGTRGITYELLLTSLKPMLPANVQKVLISAVISNAPALGEWLNGSGSAVVTGTHLIPTFRTDAFVSWLDALGRLEFVAENDPDKGEFFVPRVIEQITLLRKPKERRDRVFPERSDGQSIALALGLKLVKNGAVAIFCGRKTTAANLCQKVLDTLERKAPLAIPLAFSDLGETRRLHYQHAQNLGATATATQCAQIGIFSHHGNTPHGIRLAVEHAMRQGSARFVICTSTLAQGVNLPIRYLIVTSVYQGEERIKVRDFHNLIGRAGRAGMHTEGSILFADPDVYDKKNDSEEKWRWGHVKELLEPANSEPCISSLLSFFDPIRSDDRKHSLKPEAFDFLTTYINAPERLNELVEELATRHADKKFTRQGLNRQISWKISLISAIESFLMSQWDASGTPLTPDQAAELATGTLAFFLADAEEKLRIVSLFRSLAENVGTKVVAVDQRKVYAKTLYGVAVSQAIENWTRDHMAELSSCETFSEMMELLWPPMTNHIQNPTFRKCTSPDALREVALGWIAGQSFDAMLDILNRREARLTWGSKFRQFNIEHVVDMCEGGLAYDASLFVGAIVEMAQYIAPNVAAGFTDKFQLLQKSLKYGLSPRALVVLYEIGFADRALASRLANSLGLSSGHVPSKGTSRILG